VRPSLPLPLSLPLQLPLLQLRAEVGPWSALQRQG